MGFCFIQICKTAPIWPGCTTLPPMASLSLKANILLGWQSGPPASSLRHPVVSTTNAFSGTIPFLFLSLPTHWSQCCRECRIYRILKHQSLAPHGGKMDFLCLFISYFLGSVSSSTLLSCPVLHRSCCHKVSNGLCKVRLSHQSLVWFSLFFTDIPLPFVSVLEPEVFLSSPLTLHSVPSWFYREA